MNYINMEFQINYIQIFNELIKKIISPIEGMANTPATPRGPYKW